MSESGPEQVQDHEVANDEPTDNFNSMTNEQLMEIFRTFIPIELMLETLFVPFLQDYQPSIGDVDPFIKIGRPDGKIEPLGLVVLDEYCINQTDPTILKLHLQSQTKGMGSAIVDQTMSIDERVRVINADKQQIDDWIKSVEKIHSIQGPAEMQYTIRPPADTILELWDPDMESILSQVELPKPNIDLSLEEYAKLCCILLDIPVSDNIIESVHMFFQNYRDVLDETEVIKNAQQTGYTQ
ncbi:Intraflagellar_transport complex B protein 46 [Hexamita inflata]|uniref:Intraflagellar transport complex B protein 46 n=1 Tax=Hexamita inflata TaxID=28002 RepID=A0AA86UKG4_9EUKA|nr:Intraflagellar transport complex B protein 46 [Hexamita inflata]CAI9944162.1 Intraflagellar transport complex B protein 46 [Hexamita inflata]CAI9954717.1 Intraflagellar transport complex B protein 46 [Hexamita inflata]